MIALLRYHDHGTAVEKPRVKLAWKLFLFFLKLKTVGVYYVVLFDCAFVKVNVFFRLQQLQLPVEALFDLKSTFVSGVFSFFCPRALIKTSVPVASLVASLRAGSVVRTRYRFMALQPILSRMKCWVKVWGLNRVDSSSPSK